MQYLTAGYNTFVSVEENPANRPELDVRKRKRLLLLVSISQALRLSTTPQALEVLRSAVTLRLTSHKEKSQLTKLGLLSVCGFGSVLFHQKNPVHVLMTSNRSSSRQKVFLSAGCSVRCVSPESQQEIDVAGIPSFQTLRNPSSERIVIEEQKAAFGPPDFETQHLTSQLTLNVFS